MRKVRKCSNCQKNYGESEFKSTDTPYCKPCGLITSRLNVKFSEMLASPITGLAELDAHLNEWYSATP